MEAIKAIASAARDSSTAAADAPADSDVLLVERVQAGDVAAFDTLVVKYRERLYSVIYNITGNREDASDLTQDSMIRAFQSISSFKRKSSFYTWLYRIAVNTSLAHLRRNRLRRFFSFEQMHEDGIPPEMLDTLVSHSGSDRRTMLKELQEKLNEALQSLSHKHRTVVVLHEVEGLDHADIAEIMNCSVGTVRSRLHYAKQQLQAALQAYIS